MMISLMPNVHQKIAVAKFKFDFVLRRLRLTIAINIELVTEYFEF